MTAMHTTTTTSPTTQLSYPATFFHISNAVTYLSLLGGALACLAAVALKNPSLVGAAIALSVLSDLFDGRFARLFNRTDRMKSFGIQIDSLVDAVSFGAAPALCAAALTPPEGTLQTAALVAIAFFYNLCALTRLGFYNVHASQTDEFIGLPTTQMGLAWSLFLFVHPSFYGFLAFMFLGGVAMVCPVPIPRPRGKAFAAVCVITIAAGIAHLTFGLAL